MSRPAVASSVLVALFMVFLAHVREGRGEPPAKAKAPPTAKKAPPKAEPAKIARRSGPLRNKLGELITLTHGIDPGTPFRDAIEFLTDRYEVTILMDTAAFKEEGVDNVEEQAIRLPRMTGVRFGTVLRKLAAQVHGVYLLKADHIEITTAKRGVEAVWGALLTPEETEQPGRPRPGLPLVYAAFANTPLDAALRELVEQTGFSVILDSARAGDRARVPITATLDNVPLDGAVRLLAGQADLHAVLLDSVLYVSTRQHALALREEHDRLSPAEGMTPEMVLAQQLRQAVDLNLEEIPLNTALKLLARETGARVLLDRRVEREAQGNVTLHLKDVSAETALRLTAEQAGLKTVMVGEVVYVTSEANATKMRAEQDRKLASTAKAMGLGGLGALGLGGGAPGLVASGLGALGGGGGALGMGGGMLGFSGGMAPGGLPKLIDGSSPPAKSGGNLFDTPRQPSPKAAPSKEQAARATPRFTQLNRKLTEVVSLTNGIEANTPLKDALDYLGERYGLTPILIDNAAFQAEGTDNLDDSPVRLPRMNGVRLGTILEKLVAQVHGAIMVRSDHIEITTVTARRLEISGRPNEESVNRQRRLLPLAHAGFEQRPLDDALRELAAATGFNITLDTRHAGDKSKAAVTALLNNVPLDTAVRLLADQVDLQEVLLDDVLQVTTKDQAGVLRLEQERLNQKGMEFPSSYRSQAGAQ